MTSSDNGHRDPLFSEDAFRRLAENSPAVLFQLRMSPERAISVPFVSGRIRDLSGLPAKDIVEDPSRLLAFLHPDDESDLRQAFSDSANRMEPIHRVFRGLREGEVRWVEVHASPETLEDGSIRWDGCLTNITHQKVVEEELRSKESLLREIAANYPSAYFSIIERDLTVGFTGGQGFQKRGLDPDDFVGLSLKEIFGEHSPEIERNYLKTFDGEETAFEIVFGEEIQSYRTVPLYADDGSIPRILAAVEDVTEERRAQAHIAETAQRIARQNEIIARVASSPAAAEGRVEELSAVITEAVARAFDIERVGVWLFDEGETELFCVNLFEATPGRHSSGSVLTEDEFRDEFSHLRAAKYIDANETLSDPRVAGYVEDYFKPLGITSMLDGAIRAEGRNLGVLCLEHVNKPYRWDADEIAFVCQLADQLGMAIQARERRQAQARLQESEEHYRQLFEAESDAVLLIDNETGRILRANQAACSLYGYTREELLNFLNSDLSAEPEETRKVTSSSPPAPNEIVRIPLRWHRKKNGVRFPVEITGRFFSRKGRSVHIAAIRDITERLRAVEALRDSEARWQFALEGAGDGLWDWDANTNKVFFSRQWKQMLGYEEEEIGNDLSEWQKRVHPDDLQETLEELRKHLEGETSIYVNEHRLRCKDGTYRWILDRGKVLTRGTDGEPLRIIGTHSDITDRRREEAEKERLQTQLLQSQKMESVGRLAGGVAHDFNNMLSVILGHTELAMARLDPSGELHADLLEIQKAGLRSADLTRQLLAFARLQTVKPEVLDLNETASGMLKMLQRLIGEDIELAWLPAPTLWPVRIDAAQLDQILANLCVNARDAIVDVGKITIETQNTTFDDAFCSAHPGFRPGDYVSLAISDDGIGMEKNIIEHLFEPFFTTKGVGEGTGLGLATVYGIVKQNEGFINVYSEPGEGTTIKIYLPRVEDIATETPATDTQAPPESRGETVLLVEDEAAILKVGSTMLRQLGYSVLEALSPGEALDLVSSHEGEIDLLITDVVMPEMNGRDLAARIGEIRTGIGCLFMSGYTANVIAHHGVLEAGVMFIQKPFSLRDLAVKVRETLDTR